MVLKAWLPNIHNQVDGWCYEDSARARYLVFRFVGACFESTLPIYAYCLVQRLHRQSYTHSKHLQSTQASHIIYVHHRHSSKQCPLLL